MVETNADVTTSPQAGAERVNSPLEGWLRSPASEKSHALVPIRSLGANHRERIAHHLLALDQHDRYLRFGFSANDEQIQRYADSLNFERDEIFGIYNRRLHLLAMAHLAFSADSSLHACAEFGVSVSKSARGRGYGARLFDRAAMHARNDGVSRMFIHALSENTTMLKIARNAGAIVERDGSESEAHLYLPPATLDTRLTELVAEQFAQADYGFKVQVKQFWDVLAELQTLRRDVQDAQRTPLK
ncbi:GNAT family N-acetyltransferase [Rhodoferax sp. UBA5149]|uniref:GNAT family N-acetyltransferase n=1 Tax=Rhodoferax sp. UBA5149 TaxID=1947379 RepID=UPI0025D615AC|nr:GNAT family N-acetyltransferase [Rhodoferax sp. UBA5149]